MKDIELREFKIFLSKEQVDYIKKKIEKKPHVLPITSDRLCVEEYLWDSVFNDMKKKEGK